MKENFESYIKHVEEFLKGLSYEDCKNEEHLFFFNIFQETIYVMATKKR